MSVIVKGGGGKSSGLYVWAKYNADIGLGESTNNIALANDGTSIDIYVKENLYIKEDGTIGVQGEPYSTVSISSVVEDTCIGGMTPTKYCVGVDGNVYSSPLSHIAGSVDNCLANLVKVVKSTFIDFVVSDSETAYPDGAVHTDDYWYELFDGSGAYVWKKCYYGEGETETQLDSVSFSAFSSSLSVCDVYYSKSYSYDKSTNTYTLTNPSSFEISKFSGKTLTDYIDQYFMFGGSSGSTMYKFTDSSAHESGTEYITNVIQIQYTTTENFLGFVVNDDSTAYPDGGTQDGYWYEKVVEWVDPLSDTDLISSNIRKDVDIWGVVGTLVEGATVKKGNVTFSSTTTNPALSTNIAHGLGVKPTVFGLNKVVIKYNGDRSAVTHTITVTANATNLVVKLSDNNTSDWDTTMTSLSWYAGV